MRSRALVAAALVGSLAFGSMAAERRLRPVNVYLSTGSADSDCSPTVLTTRAVGQSNCGPIAPTGGATTWSTDPLDEGFPFIAQGDQEAQVTVVIGSGIGFGTYDVTVDVTLDGDEPITASHTEAFDAANGDLRIEFSIPIEDEQFIDGGKVTVTAEGLGAQSYFVDGSGGSFIRILPVPED